MKMNRNIKNMDMKMIINVKCKYCGYGWKSRTKNPKSCPLCKRYLIEKPIQFESGYNEIIKETDEERVNNKKISKIWFKSSWSTSYTKGS